MRNRRILPESCRAQIQRDSWNVPPIFDWLQKLGDIASEEMEHVFNMGIGFVLIADPFFAESIQRQLSKQNVESWLLGEVIKGNKGVEYIH